MSNIFTRSLVRSITTLGLVGVCTAGLVSPSNAAAALSLTTSGLAATVAGNTVSVTTTMKSSAPATASLAGICSRSATNGKTDFPLTSNVALNSSGTTVTGLATFPTGTFTYWSCAKVNNAWIDIDAKKSFTVLPPDAASTSPIPITTPSTAMPVGDEPGFKQTFTEDFTTPLPLGGFPGSYSNKWMSYNGFTDSRGKGDYNQKIISVHDGAMDMWLHNENGRPQGAAPVPLPTGSWGGQTYGKFSVRFRSDAVTGYGAAWLLWPDSNDWKQGEIDFPEGALDGKFMGFNHCINTPSVNCDFVVTNAAYTSWHTASVEWTPNGVKYILDGITLKNSTAAIPSNPMHWVLQTETNDQTVTGAGGHVYVDWVTMYNYAP